MNIDTHRIKDGLLNFLVPLVCLGATLLIFFTIIFPSFKQLPTLKTEVEAQITLENQLRTKLTALNDLIDFNEELQENSDLISKVLVSEPEVPLLLTQIDSIAKESGLEINKLSYSFGESPEEDALITYSFVNVSLGALANYEQMGVFLKNLENSARFVDVSNYRFSEENALDKPGIYNITFILRSPYLSVDSQAVTDEPINIDIGDPEFLSVMDKLRAMKFYGTTINDVYVNVEESTPEEIEGTFPAEEVPGESNVPVAEVEDLIAQ